MKKSKLYVDPRQEKLWPDISYNDLNRTWKDLKEEFFGTVNFDWSNPPSLAARAITLRDLEDMAIRLPPIPLGNYEPRLERSIINPFTQMYGQEIFVPGPPLHVNCRHVNFENWQRLARIHNEQLEEETNELG